MPSIYFARMASLSAFLLMFAVQSAPAAAALVEFNPQLDPSGSGVLWRLFNGVSARHSPLYDSEEIESGDYSPGNQWEATSGAAGAGVNTRFTGGSTISQSVEVGTWDESAVNWGDLEASANSSITFRPTQQLRYSLNASFSLVSEVNLNASGWQVMLWEWRGDEGPVALEHFQDPAEGFSGSVSGVLQEGVMYGLSSGIGFVANLDGSLPITSSLIDGAGDTQLQLTAVPLPAAAWLFASALLGLGFVKRHRL